MADPFIGEIRLFAGNFPPTGWATCDGQLLPISQNTALFSILGTQYGGDGKSNFALPNLQGRVPMHAGASAGPGLTQRVPGEAVGSDAVALIRPQIGAHHHTAYGTSAATQNAPDATTSLAPTADGSPAYHPVEMRTHMKTPMLKSAGAGAPHNNLQPYLALTFIIALQGIFPPRA